MLYSNTQVFHFPSFSQGHITKSKANVGKKINEICLGPLSQLLLWLNSYGNVATYQGLLWPPGETFSKLSTRFNWWEMKFCR